jgi:ubiquinone/menaquinone biosynthesis C-methylase UbiE
MVPEPGRLTLDIGCGEGRVSRDLRRPGIRYSGSTVLLLCAKLAATYPEFRDHPEGPRVIAADATKLPLADNTVDCAIAFMCLQNLDDMPRALTDIARVLEEGRQLVLAFLHPMYSHFKITNADEGSRGESIGLRNYFQPTFQRN